MTFFKACTTRTVQWMGRVGRGILFLALASAIPNAHTGVTDPSVVLLTMTVWVMIEMALADIRIFRDKITELDARVNRT